MPEANVLYAVTAVVVTGLVLWVSAVLKIAKTPWAREPLREAPAVPAEEPSVIDDGSETKESAEAKESATGEASETSEATESTETRNET